MNLEIIVTRPDKPRTEAQSYYHPDDDGLPLDFDYYCIPVSPAMIRIANHIRMVEEDDGSWEMLSHTIFNRAHAVLEGSELDDFVKHWELSDDELDYLIMLGQRDTEQLISMQVLIEHLRDDRDGNLIQDAE